jgi:predicted negative regulator of RcsB-dependent stress response
MATLDLEEQEQLQALKDWWHDNSNWILGSLLTLAVVVGGWKGWGYYQTQQISESAHLYEGFVRQIDSHDAQRINDAAAAMRDKFHSTVYAARATLMAAQVNIQSGDASPAKTQLQWVIDNSSEPSLQDVAKLHFAALLLDERSYDEAVKWLESEHAASFDGLYADLKGDVLSAQGKIEAARSAYNIAYEKVGVSSAYRGLIEIKIDSLGES